MKAAIIKALILQDSDPEEADELLDSSNKAVLNMEYLKKIMYVIGKDLHNVALIADKRVHNMYCTFNPNLKPFEMIHTNYPIPEPYVLSDRVIIPETPDMNPEDKYIQRKMTPQERIEAAFLQDDVSLSKYNPSLGFIPEELEEYERSSFEDRTPQRIADSGTAGLEKWFNRYLLADAKSLYLPTAATNTSASATASSSLPNNDDDNNNKKRNNYNYNTPYTPYTQFSSQIQQWINGMQLAQHNGGDGDKVSTNLWDIIQSSVTGTISSMLNSMFMSKSKSTSSNDAVPTAVPTAASTTASTSTFTSNNLNSQQVIKIALLNCVKSRHEKQQEIIHARIQAIEADSTVINH